MMQKEFDDWFYEVEGYGLRSERFWFNIDSKNNEIIKKWLQSAFEMGYNLGKQLYGGTE